MLKAWGLMLLLLPLLLPVLLLFALLRAVVGVEVGGCPCRFVSVLNLVMLVNDFF